MGAYLISCVLLGLGMAAANPEALKAVSGSANAFSTNFFKTVSASTPGNLICSPLSVDMVLSMLSFGAQGKTLQQLQSGLQLPSDVAVTKAGYKTLIDQLNNVKNVDLKLANKVFTAESLPVKPNYLTTMKDVFNSEIQKVEFGRPAEAAGTINKWCQDKTNNRIKDIVKPADLGSDTLMVLANAIYFKGDWADKFNVNFTSNRTFHLNAESTKQVPFMFKRARFNTGVVKDMNARFVELPYKGNEFSMVIILPNEINGLESLRQNIEKINLTEMLNSGSRREIELYLPKFEIESEMDLGPVLVNMGMDDMFGRTANFSLMSDQRVAVSKAIQKAYIKVDEEGSEAAAVTVVLAVGMNSAVVTPILRFIVDRPFIAKVIKIERKDMKLNSDPLLLFTAKVQAP